MARTLDQYEHPQSPIRDDSKLGPTEDLDREPDGFPHLMYVTTLLASLVIALVLLALWTRKTLDLTALILVGVPIAIIGLAHKAERDRDHRHPSR